jgi:hypothetical protein
LFIHAPSRPRLRPLLLTLALTASAATAVPGVLPHADAATPGKSGILLGIVGDVASANSATGQSFPVHRYGNFSGKVPKAKMITVRSSASWQSTANLKSGSAAYADVVRWADTIKARSGKIYVAFHHEPESQASSKFGNATDYKAAFRRIVTIFRNRGANNVIWTWQMTDWAFRTSSSDRQYAAKWYPGDAYVDVVGADPYNWYTCGAGQGRWMSLKALTDPLLAFAKAHGKQAALPEFASQRNSRRASWLTDARDYLAAHDSTIAAVFYYNERPMNPASQDCTWKLSTSTEWSAMRSMARNSSFRS